MARKIDQDKIKRIKEATMLTIVENGIESTTIAMIAKNAEVSGGYLYRIYAGKQDLINELYYEKMDSIYTEISFLLALNHTKIEHLIKSFIQNRIVYYINEPIASQFYYQLLHNENFTLTDELKSKGLNVIVKIYEIGRKSEEISESISLYQLYYHLFLYSIDYLNFKRKNIFELQESIDEDVTFLTQNIMKILKKQ
ncbi:TetR/AcrR family transcriptional regulator [Yeosuana sp.]|uniref:TetR/AcrR family transcriptional regulator n=1 Tax=Yeosuana sp. TaxID=2529388 RepID=UPI004054B6AF|tara:strand:- start:3489 stop:4079 length:591 start_codon:yes stop_codon:yes gene_type:complete